MVFIEHAHDVDADDLLGPPRERQGAKESLATGYLTTALADGDWHDSARLKTVAGAVGISEPTLETSRADARGRAQAGGIPVLDLVEAPSWLTPLPPNLSQL